MREELREILLVDGYNIINAWEKLSEEARKVDLASARDKLIDIMADYSASTGVSVIIVFDAHQVDRNIRTNYVINGVKVIFTKEGETADNFIEKLVDAIGRKEKVKVATSDWIEQQIVMGRGAERISARELLSQVNEIVSKRRALEKSSKNEYNTLGDILDPQLKERLKKRLSSAE